MSLNIIQQLEEKLAGERKQVNLNTWNDPKNRERAIKWLVRGVRGRKKWPDVKDFKKNGLSGLLAKYYSGSPLDAILDVYEETNPELKDHPWTELEMLPNGYWKNSKNRKKATEWVVGKVKEDGRKWPDQKDFLNNGLNGLPKLYGSLLECLLNVYEETNPELKDHPWTELEMLPNGYWKTPENREKGIKWIVEKVREGGRKWPRRRDFLNNGLIGLLKSYKNYPINAILDVYEETNPELKDHPWTELEMLPKNYWKNSKNRKKAIRWMIGKIKKDGRIWPNRKDFEEHLITLSNTGLKKLLVELYGESSKEFFVDKRFRKLTTDLEIGMEKYDLSEVSKKYEIPITRLLDYLSICGEQILTRFSLTQQEIETVKQLKNTDIYSDTPKRHKTIGPIITTHHTYTKETEARVRNWTRRNKRQTSRHKRQSKSSNISSEQSIDQTEMMKLWTLLSRSEDSIDFHKAAEKMVTEIHGEVITNSRPVRAEYKILLNLLDENILNLEQLVSGITLDLGCGVSPLMDILNDKNAQIIGLDTCPEFTKVCRNTFPENNYVQSNFPYSLPFRFEIFDNVFALSCLHYNNRPEKLATIAHINQLLKKGGTLVVVEPESKRTDYLETKQYIKSLGYRISEIPRKVEWVENGSSSHFYVLKAEKTTDEDKTSSYWKGLAMNYIKKATSGTEFREPYIEHALKIAIDYELNITDLKNELETIENVNVENPEIIRLKLLEELTNQNIRGSIVDKIKKTSGFDYTVEYTKEILDSMDESGMISHKKENIIFNKYVNDQISPMFLRISRRRFLKNIDDGYILQPHLLTHVGNILEQYKKINCLSV
jgi:SAM-dependent methyltransferase